MVQSGTKLNVADNSGAKIIECIDILGYSKKYAGVIGDFISASVKEARKGGTVEKKEVVKALIVRQRQPMRRKNGTVIRFDDNAAIIVSENLKDLVGSRISGPIPDEIREMMPAITSIVSEIV